MNQRISDERLADLINWYRMPRDAVDALNELRELRKQQAAGVPDGWKLVPVEPAWEMLNACAADWQARGMFGLDTLDARAAYSAMLAAAPEAPKS